MSNIYPSIPDPTADLNSILAAFRVMKHVVDLLALNASAPNASSKGIGSAPKVFAVTSAVSTNAASLTSLTSSVTSIANEVGVIETNIATINAHLTTLDGSVGGNTSDVAFLNSEVTALQASYGVDGAIDSGKFLVDNVVQNNGSAPVPIELSGVSLKTGTVPVAALAPNAITFAGNNSSAGTSATINFTSTGVANILVLVQVAGQSTSSTAGSMTLTLDATTVLTIPITVASGKTLPQEGFIVLPAVAAGTHALVVQAAMTGPTASLSGFNISIVGFYA